MTVCHEYASNSDPTQCSKHVFIANFVQRTRKLSVAYGWECDYSTLCATELTGLSSFQKPQKPPYICHWSKFYK